jgi:hypothetical protein
MLAAELRIRQPARRLVIGTADTNLFSATCDDKDPTARRSPFRDTHAQVSYAVPVDVPSNSVRQSAIALKGHVSLYNILSCALNSAAVVQ